MKKLNYKSVWGIGAISALFLFSCQKFEEPEMHIIPDGPSSPLKLFYSFNDGNITNESIYDFSSYPTSGISFRDDGINEKAVTIGNKNYFIIDKTGLPGEVDPMNDIRNLGSFTISLWMNLPSSAASGAQGLVAITDTIHAWSNLDIFTDGTNAKKELQFKLHICNSGKSDQWVENIFIPNVLDKWTHFIFRYNGKSSLFTLFRDGEIVVRRTLTDFGNIRFVNAKRIVIGTFQNSTIPSETNDPEVFSWAGSFKGSLDQFRLYNVALTDQEVIDLYNSKE